MCLLESPPPQQPEILGQLLQVPVTSLSTEYQLRRWPQTWEYPHWFFPSQTGRRTSSFSFLDLPLTQTHSELKEKSFPFGEDHHYYYHTQWWPQFSRKSRENARLFPLPFLHCDWPVLELPTALPLPTPLPGSPNTLRSQSRHAQPHDSRLYKEIPWHQLPGNICARNAVSYGHLPWLNVEATDEVTL